MKNVQLIFCVETNKQADTDFIYISGTIKEFYQLDSYVKLSPVYMNGKGKHDSLKTEREISNLKKEYAAVKRDSKSYVIYCLDCDKYDSIPEDRAFLEKAKHYCEAKEERRFVWFCRDVEDVFWGKQIEKKSKKNEASKFKAKDLIKEIDISVLTAKKY